MDTYCIDCNIKFDTVPINFAKLIFDLSVEIKLNQVFSLQ